jgi:hypothetical protein
MGFRVESGEETMRHYCMLFQAGNQLICSLYFTLSPPLWFEAPLPLHYNGMGEAAA